MKLVHSRNLIAQTFFRLLEKYNAAPRLLAAILRDMASAWAAVSSRVIKLRAGESSHCFSLQKKIIKFLAPPCAVVCACLAEMLSASAPANTSVYTTKNIKQGAAYSSYARKVYTQLRIMLLVIG